MHFHRLHADVQRLGDLLVEQAGQHQLHHFLFAFGQRRQRLVQPRFALVLLARNAVLLQAVLDLRQQALVVERFLQKIDHPQLERGHRVRHVAVAGQHHNRRAVRPCGQRLQQHDAAHAGQT
ncbi:hypothetical protein D3C78_1468020 [compost metagenome]